MKSRYLCERCKVKNCSGFVRSSKSPLESFHFCPKFVFDDGTLFSQADRIRNMSDEELAGFLELLQTDCEETECKRCQLENIKYCDCSSRLEWLKSEVSE